MRAGGLESEDSGSDSYFSPYSTVRWGKSRNSSVSYSSLFIKWAQGRRCGKIPSLSRTAEVTYFSCLSLLINLNYVLNSHQWVERRKLSYNPSHDAEYTVNGKINRGALILWPVNQNSFQCQKLCLSWGQEYFCSVGQLQISWWISQIITRFWFRLSCL